MMKRILAITLCLVMLCTSLFGCAKKDENDLGAYITTYLTDNIYDFDPANAYYNSDAINVLSMMYDTLFKLDEDGDVVESLVDSYKIVENAESDEYYIEFTLKEAYWSVKDQLTAEDIVFAWKRLVDFRNGYDSASLLYDVKNARAIKEGDVSIDDLGVEAVENLVVKVSFDAPIDYDQFFLNLTSVATAPLLKRYVSTNADWAKKGSTIATSGPFKLGKVFYAETGETAYDDRALRSDGTYGYGNSNKVKEISYFILERNSYYYRDTKRDDIDESVTPYRLLVDCTKTPEELLADYKDNKLFYIGNIPLSLRTGENAEYIKKQAEVSNALSTFICQLNEDALISDGGTGSYLFANAKVRQALSKAIDRTAIANAIVFAEAASGLVAPGVFDKGTSGEFRTSKLASQLLNSTADSAAAAQLLSEAGITPASYSFTIKVAAYDEIHVVIANMIKDAWCALGFNVTVELAAAIENNDYFAQTDSVPPDVCDDLFVENYHKGNFEVVAMDATAFSADAFSVLSNYAYAFSGYMYSDTLNDIYEYDTHLNGYDSVDYNILIEAVYYIPYYANLENVTSDDPNANPYVVKHAETKPYVQAAEVALRKLNDAKTAIAAVVENGTTDFTPTEENGVPVKIPVTTVQKVASEIAAQIGTLETAAKQAIKNVVALKASDELTAASQNASQAIIDKINASLSLINKAAKDAETAVKAEEEYKKVNKSATASAKQKEEALNKANTTYDTALASAQTALQKAGELLSATEASATALIAVKDGVNQKTLKELVKEIYDANGIVPTTKSSKWAEQKSILLHKAEELLLTDMAVIPVIFNQNAVILNTKQVRKVTATYYAPAYFRKASLKNYTDYTYYDADAEKTESIFKKFPEIYWDKIGQ